MVIWTLSGAFAAAFAEWAERASALDVNGGQVIV
jgi:hypothetical protein